MVQPELFANYELKTNSWYSSVLKILGGSLLLHTIVLASAIYIPVVRDAFYVANLFSESDLKMVDEDYTKTEIGDATIIQLPPGDRFRYPEGYFSQLDALPSSPVEDFVALGTEGAESPFFDPSDSSPLVIPTPYQTAPPINVTPESSYIPLPPPSSAKTSRRQKRTRTNVLPKLPPNPQGTPPVLPKPDENVIAQAVPSASPSPTALPTPKTTLDKTTIAQNNSNANQNANQNANKQPNANATAENDPDKINRKPLVDYANSIVERQKSGKVNLDKEFSVLIEGELTKEGKLQKAKTTPVSGDLELSKLATELIAALNDSGVLTQINTVTKDSPKQSHKVRFAVSQDQKNITVKMDLDFDDERMAIKIYNGANGAIALTQALRADKIEAKILTFVKPATNGKQVVFNTVMPRDIAQRLIQEQLAAAEKKATETPQQQSQNLR